MSSKILYLGRNIFTAELLKRSKTDHLHQSVLVMSAPVPKQLNDKLGYQ